MIYTPGTTTPYINTEGSVFGVYSQMIKAADGLSLAQVCSITGLENSTVQNWVKRGYVANPVKKKYYDRQLARILIINALRNCMQIEQAVALLKYLNGDVEDERDDAIPEPRLYDYFCEVTKNLSPEVPVSRDNIVIGIKNAIRDFEGKYADSAAKLYNTLEIMCFAHVSALYKREAELCYKLI